MSRVPSADLFDLIKSMTKGEKRFFKLFAARHAIGGRNKYVALFDAIDRQESYDERALIESNRSLRSIDLRSMKPYLHDLILRSLRDALRDCSPVAKLQVQMDKAQILIYKGLYTQAARILARAAEKAREGNYTMKLLEILFIESQLKVRSEETNTLERHTTIHEEQMAVLAKLTEEAEYYNLFMKVYYLQLQSFDPRSPEERGKVDAIMSSPYLGSDRTPVSPYSVMTRFEVLARCSLLIGDFEGELRYATEKIAFLDASPSFRDYYRYEYLYACGKALQYYVYFRRYEEYDLLMARLKSLCEEPIRQRADLELIIYYHDFLYLVERCRFEEARLLVPEIVAFMERDRQQIEASSVMQLEIAFLILAIKVADFKEALHWLGELLNDRQFDGYTRWIEVMKMLGVIVYFELGDDRGLESAIRSFYRFLRKKCHLSAFDSTLLLFLRKLPGITDRRELRRALEELHAALTTLRETPEGKMRLFQFDFITWLESKITGRTFAAALREKERTHPPSQHSTDRHVHFGRTKSS